MSAIDKSGWGDGPWQVEPDRLEWRHAGIPCLMVRHSWSGHWCGYVGVSPEHPWHGKSYSDEAVNVNVHGGLTYSDECHGKVCHDAQPGEPEHVWWFGFDCAHCLDLSPGVSSLGYARNPEEQYRDATYVESETNRLAEQVQRIQTRLEVET